MQPRFSAQGRSPRTEIIPLLARPETILEDHVDAKAERARRDLPLHGLDGGAFCLVVAVADDASHPLVRRQTQGGQIALESSGEGRLA